MQQAKGDKSYVFHFNPIRSDRGNEMTDTFLTDWNV